MADFSVRCLYARPDYAGVELPAGESLSIALSLVNDQGSPIGVSGGRFELQIRNRAGAVVAEANDAGDETGRVLFALTAEQTIAIGSGAYMWDVFVVAADGARRAIVKPSRFTLTASVTARMPHSTFFWGVGAHGLDATGIAALENTTALRYPSPLTLSPSGQAMYFVVPSDYVAISVSLSGFAVPMLAAREVTIEDVTYRVLETEELHTGVGLVLAVT